LALAPVAMNVRRPRFGFRAGLTTGIGFGVGLIVVMLLYDWIFDFRKKNVVFSEDAHVSVTEHRLQREKFNASVVGVVENKGQDSWRYVHVRVELQDANGTFVEACNHTLDGVLRPGQTQNFKVTCFGSDDRPLVEFAKYVVIVSDGIAANDR
jgi:hypothetical protein